MSVRKESPEYIAIDFGGHGACDVCGDEGVAGAHGVGYGWDIERGLTLCDKHIVALRDSLNFFIRVQEMENE